MNVVRVALILSAVLFGFCAVAVGTSGMRFARDAVRTRALVVSLLPGTDGAASVPNVQLTTPEGEQYTGRAQTYGRAARAANVGDTVEVLYTKKKVLGLTTWNIFIVEPGKTINPYRMMSLVGVLFGVLAVGMLVAGIRLPNMMG